MDAFERVAQATVFLPQRVAQGVFVTRGHRSWPEGHVVTAAHCLEYDQDLGAGIALGDFTFYEVVLPTREKLRMAPEVIDVAKDVAVLGRLDPQEFAEDNEAFDACCVKTPPVRVQAAPYKSHPYEFTAHVRSHERKWLRGRATIFRKYDPWFWANMEEQIRGGTSGGPIVNDAGELVGVVSHASDAADGQLSASGIPLLKNALPICVLRKLRGLDD